MRFGTNNIERMRVTSGGCIGIGTTNPGKLFDLATAVNTEPLVLRNSAASVATGTTTGIAFALNNTASSKHAAIDAVATNSSGATDLTFSSMNGNGVSFNELMRIKSIGFVGIGSSNPSAKLDVAGAVRAAGGIIFGDGTTMTTAAVGGNVGASGTTSTGDVSLAADTDANGSGQMTFATGGYERMRILNTGNIGIGNTAPLSKLAVGGSMAIGSYAANYAAPTDGLIVDGNVGIGTTNPQGNLHVAGATAIFGAGEGATPGAATIRGANATGTNIAGASLTIQAGNGTGTGGSGAINFQTAPISTTGATANALATRVSILPNGNVGIGTTTPVAKLQVAGVGGTDGIMFPDGTLQKSAAIGSGSSQWTTTGSNIYFNSGNVAIGTSVASAPLQMAVASAVIGVGEGATPTATTLRGAAASGSNIAGADMTLAASNGTGTGGSGKLLFQTSTPGASGATVDALTTRMAILANGNVGIGTTNPIAQLDVSGARTAVGSLNGTYIAMAPVTFTDSSAANATVANMSFNTIGTPTLSATNAGITTTNAYSTYIASAPVVGNSKNIATNAIALGIGAGAVGAQTNSYGLLVNAQTGASANYAAAFQGGNVGVGTNKPTALLEVSGGLLKATGGIMFADGTTMSTAAAASTGQSSVGSLSFAADTDSSGGDAITFAVKTVEQMRISNDGNVGIGSNSPQVKLDVAGAALISGNVGIGTTNGSGKLIVMGGNVGIGTTNPAGLLDVNQKLTVLSNGYVGIGTTSPATVFEADGPVANNAVGTTDIFTLHRLSGSNVSWDQWAAFSLGRYKTTASPYYPNSRLDIKLNDTNLNATESAVNTVMTLQANGNVGIGTTAPVAKLDVSGAIRSSTGGFIFPDGSTLTSAYTPSGGLTSSTDLNFIADNDANGSGVATFTTGTSERLRIDNSGNVGIGTSQPAQQLHLFGAGNERVQVETSGGSTVAALTLRSGGTNWHLFNRGGFDTPSNRFSLFENGYERMTVVPGGCVGIGSTNPTNQLEVAGAIKSTSGGFIFPDGSVMSSAVAPSAGTSSASDLNFAADSGSSGAGAIIMATHGS